MSLTVYDLARAANMSARPEFYSGRGAVTWDLDGNKLFIMYNLIKEKLGETEAKSFVTMVENIECLSATNFLNCLIHLIGNNWEYKESSESNIDVGPDSSARFAIGLATIGSALSGDHGDATEFIKSTFFDKIGYTPKEDNEYDDDENEKLDILGFRYSDRLLWP